MHTRDIQIPYQPILNQAIPSTGRSLRVIIITVTAAIIQGGSSQPGLIIHLLLHHPIIQEPTHRPQVRAAVAAEAHPRVAAVLLPGQKEADNHFITLSHTLK